MLYNPNTHVCPVCGGMPGVLPAINAYAVEATVMTALALGAAISDFTRLGDKLSLSQLDKRIQITVSSRLSLKGWLSIIVDGRERSLSASRQPLEEDTAKSDPGLGIASWM